MYYEFYIDVYLLTNFLFDYLTLFLMREARNRQSGILRMAGYAFLGAVCSTVFMLALKNARIYRMAVHLLVNPLMIYLCFRQKSIREFLKDYAAGYLIMMLAGGCMQWICDAAGCRSLFGWGLAALALVVTLFLGFIKGKREEDQIYDIKICQGRRELSTKGFLDTGNLLMDPYVKLPVSLIARDTLEQLEDGEEFLYRYIPFVSLGEEHGMIQAVTLDSLIIRRKKEEVLIKPAVFAVVEDAFLKGGEYRVILNGRL